MLARSLQNNKAVGLGAAALVGGVLVFLLWTYTTSSSASPPTPPTKPLKTSSASHAADTAEQKSEQEKSASEDQDRHSIDRRRTSLEHNTPAQEPEHSEQLNETYPPEEHEEHEQPEHPEPQATPAVSVSADVPEPAILKTVQTPLEPKQPEQPKEIEHPVLADKAEEPELPEHPEVESIPATSVSADTEIDIAVPEPATIDIEHRVPQEPEPLAQPEQPEQPEPELTATTSATSDDGVDIEVPEPAIVKSSDSAPNSGHKWADLINEVEQIALTKTQEPSQQLTQVTEQETTDIDGLLTGLPAATAPAFDHHVVKAEISNPVVTSMPSHGTLNAPTNGSSLETSIHNRDASRRELNTNAAVFTPSWLLKTSPAPTHTSGTSPAPKQGSTVAPHDSANGKSKPPRCRFWPKCTNKSCKFTHPTLPCRDPDNCTFGDRCLFVHPKDLNKRKEIRRPARGNAIAAAAAATTAAQ
ncbi:hypothetical protein KVV02_004679 [Mortierella alpina]|uniref:C3H1-type domain-containing protein n=1 Tax=Mortierella alpina TaxID=64518 RepID=A0A9P8A9A8_MORAP|nr:hypothetical protein KVV02_004679 [Mortierella alpina]